MKTIYHRVSGCKVIIHSVDEWDIRVARISETDGYELTRWYNPYHTRLGGLCCGSLIVGTRNEVDEIVNVFSCDLAVEQLPVVFPDFAVVPSYDNFSEDQGQSHTKANSLNKSLHELLNNSFNRFLSVVRRRRSSARIFR